MVVVCGDCCRCRTELDEIEENANGISEGPMEASEVVTRLRMFAPHHRWFFITGCQRSGTTLLRLVLECHPQIFCFDELHSYRALSSFSFETTISKPLVGFKIPRWAEQLDYPLLRDFGLAHEAQQIYKGQKILFLVRDYRDAIASMLKLRGNRSWLQEWAEPIIEARLRRDAVFSETW